MMLRHAIAPKRDFTQIANALIWDNSFDDHAFRLLVRALSLSAAEADATTVTRLATTLSCGRDVADQARAQLREAGLLHQINWRHRNGQKNNASMISSVPLTPAQAWDVFAAHFDGPTTPPPPPPAQESAAPEPPAQEPADVEPPAPTKRAASKRAAPGAGKPAPGRTGLRSPGTILPSGETPGENTPPTHPAPTDPDGPDEPDNPVHRNDPNAAAAERVLLSLRHHDPRLTLGAREVRALVPLAAEWLVHGVSPDGLRAALTLGLPQTLRSAKAVLRWRLIEKAPSAPVRVKPMIDCPGCDRPFRPVTEETRCGPCRRQTAETAAEVAVVRRPGSVRALLRGGVLAHGAADPARLSP